MPRRRLPLGLIAPIALVILVTALGALQYRWVGQVSERERDQLRQSLDRRARNCRRLRSRSQSRLPGVRAGSRIRSVCAGPFRQTLRRVADDAVPGPREGGVLRAVRARRLRVADAAPPSAASKRSPGPRHSRQFASGSAARPTAACRTWPRRPGWWPSRRPRSWPAFPRLSFPRRGTTRSRSRP